MDRRRLIYYLLLNIFVSACVTSVILYWYDRNYRSVSLPLAQAPVVSTSATSFGPTQPVQQGTVQIVSVVGAGTLAVEMVTIKYAGEGELNLTNWQIKDKNGNTYTFPPFKLFTNGAIRIHTTSGANTAVDLFWGQNKAVWQSGETVLLTNPQGDVQDSYPVP
ncbi:MAG: lamin tail domain-containing protein [Chloroflexi bacterium]|nr:lamin tail domain-containing protein [Chloroflexota bacterium]MBI1855826.1 lamin tail domain-containing protein [Chloroflexota bacterium]MBI3338692.1 lamin tail domain-containing protein [Chloroflexota bacterium]